MLEDFKKATEKFQGMSNLSLASCQELDRLCQAAIVGMSPEQSRPLIEYVKELKYNYPMARIANNFVQRALAAEHAGSTDLMRIAHVELMLRYQAEIAELNKLVHVGNLDQYWNAFDRMTDAVRNAR